MLHALACRGLLPVAESSAVRTLAQRTAMCLDSDMSTADVGGGACSAIANAAAAGDLLTGSLGAAAAAAQQQRRAALPLQTLSCWTAALLSLPCQHAGRCTPKRR